MNAVNGFTPGPWKYRVHMNTHGGWKPPEQVVEVWGGKQLIAYYSTSSDEFPGDAESEANARLIASAPELLGQHEADMVDLDLLAEAIHAGDPMPELVIRIADMLNRKIDVIRKATGASA